MVGMVSMSNVPRIAARGQVEKDIRQADGDGAGHFVEQRQVRPCFWKVEVL